MRLFVVFGAIATLVFAAVSAEAASPGFRFGVAVGEVTATSAVVWTRAAAPGKISVVASADLGRTKTSFEFQVVAVVGPRAARTDDLAIQVRVPRLRPDTTYEYYFRQGKSRSPVGTFTTAPATEVERSGALRDQR